MRKLAWACGAFAAAVFLGVLALPDAWLPWAALAALGLAAASRLLRGGMRRRALLAGLFLAAGFLACHAQRELLLRPCEALVGEELTVCARVTEAPTRYEDGVASVCVRLAEPGLPRVKCRLYDYEGRLPELEPGDELRAALRFASARVRYGEETEIASSKGEFLRAYLRGEPELAGRSGASLRYLPQRLRQRVIELAARVFPADAAPFQTALLLGEKRELYSDYALYYALSRAGLMHVAAVSGMHVAFLAGFVRLLFGSRRRAGVLTALLLGLFAAVVGFAPSVVRAVFMQLCLLGAPLADREGDAPTSLALILALLLAANPCAAASVSLQLSFAATAGILLFSGKIYERLLRRLAPKREGRRGVKRLVRAAAAAASCSLGALAFTTPLAALHFGTISLVAPLTNVLCTWLISALFVGGFVAVGLGALAPALGAAAGWLLAWGDRYVFFMARLLSGLPCAALYTANRVFGWWLVFVYVLIAAAWLLRDRERGFAPRLPALLAALGLGACLLVTRLDWRGLRLTVLDVGQGACALVECGERAVLIDCGGTATLDAPGQRAAYLLRSRLRRRVDALVFTHLHRDHANGAARLLALVEAEVICLPPDTGEDNSERAAVLAAAAASGTRVQIVDDALALTLGELRLDIRAVGDGEDDEPGLFVLASEGDFDILATGDAEGLLERRYVWQTQPPDIEVLLVGHHGSATSTDQAALDTLAPELALISVGYNTYGHPREEVLERLARAGAQVHRTDQEGDLVVQNRSGIW